MSLENNLNAIREKSKSRLPQEKREIMQKATAELADSGIMEKVLKTGQELPHFTLPDEHEIEVRSEDLLKKGPLIVSFYRGVW
ncbi:MAG: hypothetical protein P8X39_06350 [Desulfofustis sp.]|jgi:hypothetical protein